MITGLRNYGIRSHQLSKGGLLAKKSAPSILSALGLGAFLVNQDGKKKSNECGGMIAYVTAHKEEAKQAEEDAQIKDQKAGGSQSNLSRCLEFQRRNAHFLQKLPYYQCGLAIYTANNLEWFKYTSKGEVESSVQSQSAETTGNPTPSNDHKEEQEDDGDDSASDELRNEQLGQVDYGFKEKSYVLPQDDCFNKMFNDIDNGKLAQLKGNISILHTRFAEVNKFYSVDKGLSGIPDEHAHPSIDQKQRIALFLNGNISNFSDLWQEVRANGIACEINEGCTEPTESQLIISLIAAEIDKGLSVKDALISIIEQKILGPFRIVMMETQNPKCMFFAKNAGDFVIGSSADQKEVVVTTDVNVLSDMPSKLELSHIQNNVLCELNTETCQFSFTKLQKKINIESQRKPKATYNHIIHEEIVESIDAVDAATDFGGKFISDSQVILGGFEKAHQELSQVQDLIIQALGSSYYAAQYGAFIFKQLKIFNTVRVVSPYDVNPLLFKNIKNGGFLTLSRNGADVHLVKAIKLAYHSDLTCMNIVNQVESPITKAIDEALRERKEQRESKEKSRVLFNADSDDEDSDEQFQDKNIGMYSKCGYCYTDLKTFIPQVVCVALVAIWFSHNKLSTQSALGFTLEEKKAIIEERKKLVHDIGCLSLILKHSLQANFLAQYREIARFLKTQDNLFILSKGTALFVSDFVAQKFNQIALIHAEAYSSAEFRHGPLSMIEESEQTAVIFLVLDDETITQVLSNILQIKERGATVIVLTNVQNIETLIDVNTKIDFLIKMFELKSMFAALICTIPMLMMCYYTALEKGINPDEKMSEAINFLHEIKR